MFNKKINNNIILLHQLIWLLKEEKNFYDNYDKNNVINYINYINNVYYIIENLK